MARTAIYLEGYRDGYASQYPKYPRDRAYLHGYTSGRQERFSEHRTFSDAAVISDGMKRSGGAQCVAGGSNMNRSVGNVEIN